MFARSVSSRDDLLQIDARLPEHCYEQIQLSITLRLEGECFQTRPCEAASQSSRHLRSSDGLHHSVAHTVQVLREEHYCLPVQPRASYDGAKASAAPKIEGYDRIPGDAVERTVGTKAQTAGSAELG